MPVRAVFFDLGGTLFSYRTTAPHFTALLADVAHRHGVEAPPDELRARYQEAMARVGPAVQERPFYLHRELFGAGFLELLASYGADEGADGAALYEGQIQLGLDRAVLREGVPETLAALRRQGLHLGIVSNIDDDQFTPLWEKLGLAEHFDATTTSEEARSCKPDAGIYRLALAKANDPEPQDVVFVGDSPAHDMAGARPLGMTTVLITSQQRAVPPEQRPDHVIRQFRELLEVIG